MVAEATPSARPVVESAWRDQALWSETANRLKADLDRWRTRASVAGVVGAVLETLAATLPDLGPWWWVRAAVALVGAAVLAVVPYVVRARVSSAQVRNWVRARSASEALKEGIYRFLVGAPPFGTGAAPAALVEHQQAEKNKVEDLAVYAAGIDVPRKTRPLELTIDGYVEQRVGDQIERYYLPKARQNARAATRLHNWEFGLGLLAVVMGALAGAAATAGLPWLSGLGSWVAVVTTAGAAVTTHLAAARYDHQAITYFGTASRLAALRDAWLADPERHQPDKVARFVDGCEQAISSENEAWLADWTRRESKAPSA